MYVTNHIHQPHYSSKPDFTVYPLLRKTTVSTLPLGNTFLFTSADSMWMLSAGQGVVKLSIKKLDSQTPTSSQREKLSQPQQAPPRLWTSKRPPNHPSQ